MQIPVDAGISGSIEGSKNKDPEKRHGLIGKLTEPYPKPIRKSEKRGIIPQRIAPLFY